VQRIFLQHTNFQTQKESTMKIDHFVKFQEAFKLRRGVPKSAIHTVAVVLLSNTALSAQPTVPNQVFLPGPAQPAG